jgi:hypothetical protein
LDLGPHSGFHDCDTNRSLTAALLVPLGRNRNINFITVETILAVCVTPLSFGKTCPPIFFGAM